MTKLICLSIVVAIAACGGDGESDLPVQNSAVIVSGDFTPGAPGVMSSLDLDTLSVAQAVAPTGAVGSDPMVRGFGAELFIVNRADGNNVTILDALTFELVEQLATGAGSNPQDVAVVGNELYIPAFGTAGVVVVERGTGVTRTIDLSELDTADGIPDCVSAFAVGSEVFVACGRLDNFIPGGKGVVAVIDTANADAVTTFELQNENPFGVFERAPTGALMIPTVPDFSDFSTGCVEAVNVDGLSASCVLTNQQIGGLAARINFDASTMWVVSASFGVAGPIGNIQGLDLGTDEHLPAITPGTQIVVDFAICPGNQMVVADATEASNGVRVYAEDGSELTTAALAIGLKPASAHGLSCY